MLPFKPNLQKTCPEHKRTENSSLRLSNVDPSKASYHGPGRGRPSRRYIMTTLKLFFFGGGTHRTYRLTNIDMVGGWVRQTQRGGRTGRKDSQILIWWVGGWFFQEILPLCGYILQAGTCQILSLAENPRWSRVCQYLFIFIPEDL